MMFATTIAYVQSDLHAIIIDPIHFNVYTCRHCADISNTPLLCNHRDTNTAGFSRLKLNSDA